MSKSTSYSSSSGPGTQLDWQSEDAGQGSKAASKNAKATNVGGQPHRIVIVGGGAAGIELATRLGDRFRKGTQAGVTLVDAAMAHLWKPMLHEVAAGSLDPGKYELNYLEHAHRHGFRYHFGAMVGLDRTAKMLRLSATYDHDQREISPSRLLPYDTLVIAIGSRANDFGIPGVIANAYPLENTSQAVRFNQKLIHACLRAQTQDQPLRPGQLHIVVVGAGATGTELVAELHHTMRQIVSRGLDRIDPERDIQITLMDSAERILPALPERISKKAHQLLSGLDVNVRTNARVTEVSELGLKLSNGTFIAAEMVVWAAGVKGAPVLQQLDGLEVTRTNQLVVEPTLQTPRDPDIFAIGDCAACPIQGQTFLVPPRAQAAHQQAEHMLGQIERRLKRKPLLPFEYKDFGSLVSLGAHGTVGKLMKRTAGSGIFIEGFLAKWAYSSLRVMHERSLHGIFGSLLRVLVRIISRYVGPRVKLH